MQMDMRAAVLLVTTVLFLLSQQLAGRYRRAAMAASLAVYGALIVAVVVYIGLWLGGAVGGQ